MAAADARFMREAIEIAHLGVRAGQSPFGACVVRDGRVIARAHNTVLRDSDPSAHAEVNAVRAACTALGCRPLPVLVYSTCEPCAMCFSACHWVHVAKIVYGPPSPTRGGGLRRGHHQQTMRRPAAVAWSRSRKREQCLEIFAA
jgi:tRNA(Arg) A34 adenosine deaminase TadA